MNEACICQDGFGQSFGQETPFLQFLREREEHAHWVKEPSNSLWFEALEEGSVITQLLRDNYVLNGKEEILTDTMVTALWELPADEKMLGSYQSALEAHGKTADDLSPALRLTTSDVGISGANLYPMLFKGENSRMLPLGNPLKLSHENGADLDQFDKKLKMIFSQYSYGLKKLTDLLEVDIQYPENTLLGVMKQITIPKKLALPAIDLFRAQYGDGSCTAHDLYYAILEILFMPQCDGASGVRIAQMEENIAKALSVKWTEFDTSVPVNW